MVTITTIPPATATTHSIAIQFVEPLLPFGKEDPLSSTVSLNVTNVSVVDGVALANIKALISVMYQPKCKSKALMEMFTESFVVAFTETTENNIQISEGETTIAVASDVRCCTGHSATISTTATFTIS